MTGESLEQEIAEAEGRQVNAALDAASDARETFDLDRRGRETLDDRGEDRDIGDAAGAEGETALARGWSASGRAPASAEDVR
jgi:hypothetical protein